MFFLKFFIPLKLNILGDKALKAPKNSKPVVFMFLVGLLFPVMAGAFPYAELDTQGKNYFSEFRINSWVMQFLNEDRQRYFTGAELKFRQAVLEKSVLDFKADYTYSYAENHHYFRFYEGSLSFKQPNGEWVFGRKQINWNWADSFWKRGLWQPVYADDSLRPRYAGLTGVFRNINYEKGQIILFGSFVFVPDFSPPFESKNGKIVSENPWFIPPPSGRIGSSNSVPVYQIVSPDLTDFLRLSIAAKASYEGAYISYAYKPVNKISSEGLLDIRLDKEPVGTPEKGYLVELPVRSVILRHHLLSGGFVIESLEQQSSATTQSVKYFWKTAITYNHPETYHPPEEQWIFFGPRKDLYISFQGEARIKDPLEETRLHIAYTHLFHPVPEQENIWAKTFPELEKQFFRDDLFNFSKALSAGLSHSIKLEQSLLAQIKSRLIYHFERDYFLFSFYGSLTWDSAFSVFVSTDLLFPEFPFSIEQAREDIGIYKNKSRIFGGLSYAF